MKISGNENCNSYSFFDLIANVKQELAKSFQKELYVFLLTISTVFLDWTEYCILVDICAIMYQYRKQVILT